MFLFDFYYLICKDKKYISYFWSDMEQLLHFLWKYRLHLPANLTTTTGLSVEVIDAGCHNTDAGPDFFNAKIRIDGTIWAGNVEIHTRSSDWHKHGHHTDVVYDSVILNVVEVCDTDIFRTTGEPVLQLVLNCPDSVRAHYKHLSATTAEEIPCRNQLSIIDPFLISAWKSTLLTERLERKTDAIFLLSEQNKQNWEEIFYVSLFRSMGLGINNDAFERLARSLPLSYLLKHADSLLQIEALLFGQAGLLDVSFPENAYLQLLQREYNFLRNKFSLKPLSKDIWRFLRLRPANFPHIRLAQLAALYHKNPMLFSRVLKVESLLQFADLIAIEPGAYWLKHYDFETTSNTRSKRLGSTALQVLLINAVVPVMFAYGRSTSNEEICNRALSLLENTKAEDNRIVREWSRAGIPVLSAYDSQAILQLRNEYCEKKKCLYCRIGHRILSKK